MDEESKCCEFEAIFGRNMYACGLKFGSDLTWMCFTKLV